MLAVFAERGGDPDREGKKDPLDPLLWRAARPGEPTWDGGEAGMGRPGWHIECTCISLDYLGMSFDVQGGGTDLVFPHHEMSAVQAAGLTGQWPFARAFVHQAMVGLDGEKMSKSRGNLILVSRLREAGVDPMAVRLVLLGHHYAEPWSWTQERARRRRTPPGSLAGGGRRAQPVRPRTGRSRRSGRLWPTTSTRPRRVAAVDAWVDGVEGGADPADAQPGAPDLVRRMADALLGVRL